MMMVLFLFFTSIILNLSSSIPLVIDLTHTINPTIPFLPSQTRFNFTQRTATWINNKTSFFYATNTFITSKHMGTHIDAPYNFSTSGWKADEISLNHLILTIIA